MIARNSLYLNLVGIAVVGWGGLLIADDDVSVISAPTNAPAKTQQTADSDGTPVVHKSSHKKKTTSTAAATPDPASPAPASSTMSTPAASPKPTKTPDVVVGP